MANAKPTNLNNDDKYKKEYRAVSKTESPAMPPVVKTASKSEKDEYASWPGRELAVPGIKYRLAKGNLIELGTKSNW